MTQKRRLPSGVAKVRAGNYAAEVDTAGMDQSMKETLNQTSPSPFAGPMEKMKKMFQKKPKVKPAKPDTMSRAMEDSLSKRYLGR